MGDLRKTPAKEVSDFHNNDDVDSSKDAHHHRLGMGPNQAAPGDHNHGPTYEADSGLLGPGVGSATIYVGHSLGRVPDVVVGHLEDGAISQVCTWRVATKTNEVVGIIFYNTHPTLNAGAILRFHLL